MPGPPWLGNLQLVSKQLMGKVNIFAVPKQLRIYEGTGQLHIDFTIYCIVPYANTAKHLGMIPGLYLSGFIAKKTCKVCIKHEKFTIYENFSFNMY